ncbi:hypothetical protein [Streptomyces alanosinicus]|uniref:Uncharacterized protein n=1 Tax=Streptomyces alanosinicus TaxID=68171 RepID=A0A919D1B6_9ACTN|nr:hypothetical protein [Streptomyces alanosinicus]GHE00495.1 hypothetical protein GCM10010339_15900 [Streptomyces alanosinicus]
MSDCVARCLWSEGRPPASPDGWAAPPWCSVRCWKPAALARCGGGGRTDRGAEYRLGLWGGVLVMFGLFARAFHAGVDHLAGLCAALVPLTLVTVGLMVLLGQAG